MTASAPIVAGTLSELDLGNVLAVTSLGRQRLRLELTSATGAPVGSVVLKAGRVVSATAGARQGEEALNALLNADQSCRFSIFVEPAPIDAAPPIGRVDELLPRRSATVAPAVLRPPPPPARRAPGDGTGVHRTRAPEGTGPVLVMEGSLRDFDVATLLRTLSIGRQYSELKVSAADGKPVGSVITKSGKVLRARAEGVDGVTAVRRLLATGKEGRFSVFRLHPGTGRDLAAAAPIAGVDQLLVPETPPPETVRIRVLEGGLSEFDVPTLLQTLGTGRQYLALEVLDGDEIGGTLFTKAGMLLGAQAGPLEGRAAVEQLVHSPRHCRFILFREPGALPEGEPLGSISSVLFDIMSRPVKPAESAPAVALPRAVVASPPAVAALPPPVASSPPVASPPLPVTAAPVPLRSAVGQTRETAAGAASSVTAGRSRSRGRLVVGAAAIGLAGLLVWAVARPDKRTESPRAVAPLATGRAPTVVPLPSSPGRGGEPVASSEVARAASLRPSTAVVPHAAGRVARHRPPQLPGLGLRNAQERLSRLGYAPGPLDGRMGPRTAAALTAFQRAEGLAPTATLDPPTAHALLEAGAAREPR